MPVSWPVDLPQAQPSRQFFIRSRSRCKGRRAPESRRRRWSR